MDTWYGHVERSNGAVKTSFDIQVDRKPGRPKMIWKQLTERDRREWKLSAIDLHDRDTYRSGCQEGGPLLWLWPLYLHVNQKSDDDDDDDDDDIQIFINRENGNNGKTAPIKTGPYLCISIYRFLNICSSHYGYPKIQQKIGYLIELWISVY